jgi:predicted nucleic acid-binding Zn ribbon protein
MNKDGNQCISCGKDIAFKRSDAKYCTDRCRMRFQRKKKKIELIEMLFNLCSQIPRHTLKSKSGVFLLKPHKPIKSNQEMVSIPDLLKLSVAKLEHLIAEKKKEVNMFNLVDGISKLLNR